MERVLLHMGCSGMVHTDTAHDMYSPVVQPMGHAAHGHFEVQQLCYKEMCHFGTKVNFTAFPYGTQLVIWPPSWTVYKAIGDPVR